MKKLTKYHKKIKLTFMVSAIILCIIMVTAFSWVGETYAADNGYYVVVLNDEELGAVNSKEIIDEAMSNARLRLNEESDSIVYIEPNLKIYKQDKLFGSRQNEEQLEEKIYDVLVQTADLDKRQAYVVNIDGFIVTLSNKDEVVELLNAAKSKFDANNEFNIDLVEATSGTFSSITFNIVKADTKAKEVNNVLASEGTITATNDGTVTQKDGIVNLSFEDNIEIVESYVNSDEILELQEAIDLVTKDKETNKIYEIKQGDSLSVIASSYNLSVVNLLGMNTGLTEASVLGIGDEIVVSVPEPELSVIVQEEKTYEENYDAEVIYEKDDTMFTSESIILNPGSQGYRKVVAKVTYRNGSETGREILEQTIITEAVAKVVKIGTKTPPTFIKPLSGGTFSSGYGYRWGTIHKGIDWACPTGTAIKASCAGTVVSAGWSNGYGNAVVIRHSDGKQTRYGHLSKILVSVGQTVDQNEKIALSGNTGNSTGPHLHFEIIVNGVQVNPTKYLQ